MIGRLIGLACVAMGLAGAATGVMEAGPTSDWDGEVWLRIGGGVALAALGGVVAAMGGPKGGVRR